MSDTYSELIQNFEALRVDPETFTHKDHLIVAFDMLHRYSFLEAATKYAAGINALATEAGVPDKFNLTITLAFLSLIAERIQTSSSQQADFDVFLEKNQDLMSRKVLSQWYSSDRLNSDLARTHFLLPET